MGHVFADIVGFVEMDVLVPCMFVWKMTRNISAPSAAANIVSVVLCSASDLRFEDYYGYIAIPIYMLWGCMG
jgi:hypothetical protein